MRRTVQPPPDFLRNLEVCDGRKELFKRVAPGSHAGDWAEFGVWKGKTAGWLNELLPRDARLFLLDSWEGLPEDWVRGGNVPPHEKGRFKHKVPRFDDPRCIVLKGFFEETASRLQKLATVMGFVHIDCDLYSSTVTALKTVSGMIHPGTVIVFDELWGYPNWREGEYRALMESGIEVEWIARTYKGQAAGVVQ